MQITVSKSINSAASNCVQFTSVSGQFSELHNITSSYAHSGISWQQGHRKSCNFINCHVLVLDVDGTWAIEEAMTEFQQTKHVLIATSKSHQMPYKINEQGQRVKVITPADYFHIYIGLEEPITSKEEYLEIMSRLVNHYPVDKNVKDAARFFFPNQNQMHWYS